MKIEVYETLAPLLSAALVPGALTNGIPSAEECGREIAAGALHAFRAGEGWILSRSRGNFARLNYLLVPPLPSEIPPLGPEKAVVAEIAGRTGDPKAAGAEELFLCSGFSVLCRRIRMSRPKDSPLPDPSPVTVPVRTAGEEDAEEIAALLAASFDPLTGCLPTADELSEILARGEILAAGTEEEGIAGVLHSRPIRGGTELRHLAVAPGSRRKGVGRALVRRYLAETRPSRGIVWLRRDNEAACSLYRSAGYAPDGWESAVLARNEAAF